MIVTIESNSYMIVTIESNIYRMLNQTVLPDNGKEGGMCLSLSLPLTDSPPLGVEADANLDDREA